MLFSSVKSEDSLKLRHNPTQRAYPLVDIQIHLSEQSGFWGWGEVCAVGLKNALEGFWFSWMMFN